jgi:LytS/YehU family sensor histidine kinase
MKWQKLIAVLVTSIIGIGIITYYMHVLHPNDNYAAMGGAIVMTIELLCMWLIAAILSSVKHLKEISQGIFTGSLLTLLVGFGVCTAA